MFGVFDAGTDVPPPGRTPVPLPERVNTSSPRSRLQHSHQQPNRVAHGFPLFMAILQRPSSPSPTTDAISRDRRKGRERMIEQALRSKLETLS